MILGTVYIVATPIGNLEDITHRAVRILSEVNCILAEDTRHSKHLLDYLNISNRVEPLHDHNEDKVTDRWLDEVAAGMNLAVISDAGTPLISDPGYRLVTAALLRGIRVVPIPGASALVAAISVAGMPTDRFVFEGFLPAKAVAKEKQLTALRHESRTIIFYEAPHRVIDSLEVMAKVFGKDRQATIARELTKIHEEVVTGTLEELLLGPITTKGEFVILVAGSAMQQTEYQDDQLLIALIKELPPSRAAAVAAELSGQPRKQLYQRAIALKPSEDSQD